MRIVAQNPPSLDCVESALARFEIHKNRGQVQFRVSHKQRLVSMPDCLECKWKFRLEYCVSPSGRSDDQSSAHMAKHVESKGIRHARQLGQDFISHQSGPWSGNTVRVILSADREEEIARHIRVSKRISPRKVELCGAKALKISHMKLVWIQPSHFRLSGAPVQPCPPRNIPCLPPAPQAFAPTLALP